MTKLGIFGGTFNPIHHGHLFIAETVLEKTDIDQVIFIPSANPPHKPQQNIISFEHRWNMLNLAISGHPHFISNDIEHKLGGISYTVQTLDALKKKYADSEIYLIIGSDSLAALQTWKDPDRLIGMTQFIVFPRSYTDAARTEKRFLDRSFFLEVPLVSISSSDIRSRVAHGEFIGGMLPEKVEQYITENKLYLLN